MHKHTLLLVLIPFAFFTGCGKKDEPAPKPSSSYETTSNPADSAEMQTVFGEYNVFLEHEKIMRGFGVDVEEKFEPENGKLKQILRINLEDRKGERLDAQVNVLNEYVAKGEAILAQHNAFLNKKNYNGALLREGTTFVRNGLASRLNLAKETIEKLVAKRKGEE